MKTLFLILISCLLLLLADCGQNKNEVKNTSRTELPSGDKLYDYYLFFLSHDKGSVSPLKDVPSHFLTGLSNEFINSLVYGDKALSNAEVQYLMVTNEPDNSNGFVYQRIGIVDLKMRNYTNSYGYINLALGEGAENPEIYYYKAMLLFYYERDYKDALDYLDRIGKDSRLIDYQDVLFLKGCLKCEKSDYNSAFSTFMAARDMNPGRFYINYDILPYFIRSEILNDLNAYIKDSFKYLISLGNKSYRLKAYRQSILYNRLQNRETLYISFNLPPNYDYFTNLLYFYSRGFPVIEKHKSQNVISPMQEKRRTARDLVYSPLFEEYSDSEGGSSIFLQEGILILTNLHLFPASFSVPIPKLMAVSNVIMLLSPTNRYEILTNLNKPTNSKDYLISNTVNGIYITNCPYDYFFTTGIFDLRNDSNWDFVTVGFNTNNKAVAMLFYPDLKKVETYSFSIKKHDSAFVIQDFNGNNKPELILLDDDAYILKN